MLKYAIMAVAAATVIAVVFVMLPTGVGQRPEPRILSSGDTVPSAGFVIRPAGPPDPATPATPPASATPPAGSGDLDAVMQRLRAGTAKPDTAAAQTQTTPSAPPAPPPTTPAIPPPSVAAAPVPPPAQWASVTGQGTRWRMARSSNGYTVSIDLGNGQVADIHVQPAFGNLDPASVNQRVDYLKDTIVQSFSRQSASYSFARDGSVSIDH